MSKKVLLGCAAVFITVQILDFLFHGVLLASTYASLTSLWRPDMESKMWIMYVVSLVGSFFFSFIFSKGYESKGIGEGLRYGFYIGVWMSMGFAYGTYAMIAIPYSLALQWFIFGVIEYMIAGVVIALVFGTKTKEAAKAESA
jgi:hypothetical protein